MHHEKKKYMFSYFIFEQQWACDLIFLQNFSVTFFSVTYMYFGKLLQLNILCLMDNIFMIKWPALDEACHTTGLESQFAAQEQWCTIYFQLWSSKRQRYTLYDAFVLLDVSHHYLLVSAVNISAVSFGA